MQRIDIFIQCQRLNPHLNTAIVPTASIRKPSVASVLHPLVNFASGAELTLDSEEESAHAPLSILLATMFAIWPSMCAYTTFRASAGLL